MTALPEDPSLPPRIGSLACGPLDNLCDVAGVTVGHSTLDAGEIQTGVTVIRPHPDDPFLWKVPASVAVLNGFGKSIGLEQIRELGVLESPIALTNTFAAGTIARAQIDRACRENPEIGRNLSSFNPLVFECNDGYLNDMQAPSLDAGHFESALAGARADFSQGSVGAGRGMSMFGLKGGIGSASRVCRAGAVPATVGSLVLANFGRAPNLLLAGHPLGPLLCERLRGQSMPREAGSIIIVLATDAPLSDRQLRRLALRAGAGLARTGSFFGHGSGDMVLAFSTAYRIPDRPSAPMPALPFVHESLLDPLFQGAAEATEQAILHALFRATALQGFRGHARRTFLEVCPDWREHCPGAPAFPSNGEVDPCES